MLTVGIAGESIKIYSLPWPTGKALIGRLTAIVNRVEIEPWILALVHYSEEFSDGHPTGFSNTWVQAQGSTSAIFDRSSRAMIRNWRLGLNAHTKS